MPTSLKVQETLLKNLPEAHRVVDLGSGWGSLAIAIARRLPQAQVTGVELSPIPYYTSVLWQKALGLPNIKFENSDILSYPLDEELIVCYLYPQAMKELLPRFEQLKPGTVIISHTFAIPGWKPTKTLHVQDMYNTPIYFYEK